MSHYKTNLRDIEFNLFEVLGRDEVLGTGPFAEVDGETARSILAEVDRLAREDLAASYEDSDRNPPVFDPETHTAPLPESFKKSYRAWMDAEYWRLQIKEELGGTPRRPRLNWAIAEMVLGSNAPIWMYGCGPAFAGVIHRNGNERDRAIAQLIVDREWGTTMVLTEPDAGSDVGAGRTQGHRRTTTAPGTSRASSGSSPAASPTCRRTSSTSCWPARSASRASAARAPRASRCSSCPKFHFDLETGELTGERNGVYVTNVEHKMGIKVSNTCELTFGDPSIGGGEPARGYLLGEVHDGIAQMFQVIENARMMVGTKAIATLSTGYLNALDYAKTRVQGADLTQSGDKTAPRVTITHHPDVRRSLMVQKSFAEAMRALVLYTASWQDKVQVFEHEDALDTDEARLAAAVNDLLLPIVKGYGSERSWVLLGTESLQTFGGSGFLQEYPLEQYVRDAKIDTLYEGTTAIQGQDFFFRKIVKDQGAALGHLAAQIQAFIDSEAGNGRLKVERELLATALEDANTLVGHMINDLMSADPTSETGDLRNIYKVGLNTTRLLMVLGDVVCAWLLLRQAEVALEKLGGVSGQGPGLLRGQGRRGAVLRADQPAADQRRGRHRAGHRPVGDGPVRGRLLGLHPPSAQGRPRRSLRSKRPNGRFSTVENLPFWRLDANAAVSAAGRRAAARRTASVSVARAAESIRQRCQCRWTSWWVRPPRVTSRPASRSGSSCGSGSIPQPRPSRTASWKSALVGTRCTTSGSVTPRARSTSCWSASLALNTTTGIRCQSWPRPLRHRSASSGVAAGPVAEEAEVLERQPCTGCGSLVTAASASPLRSSSAE